MQTCTLQKIFLSIILIGFMSFLMFFRLGQYALWDDEATTALFSQSVWETGDTHAVVGQNVVAYNSGIELKNLKNRYISPLSFYLAAPFVGMSPGSAFFARLPFACCGLLSIVLIVIWLWRSRVSVLSWILVSMGLLGNVSLILYVRQCRYYAPVILFSLWMCYLYLNRTALQKRFIGCSIAGLLLLSSNYLCYAGVMLCLGFDYLIWGRVEKKYSNFFIIGFLMTQVILGGWLLSIYNPFGVNVFGSQFVSKWIDKWTLFLWNWRELNGCEFGAIALILIAPIISFFVKDKRLVRCFMAIFIYIAVISIFSPQPINLLSVAFVRYLVPLIPLCIFLSVLCIEYLTQKRRWLAIGIAGLLFGTNVLHGGPFISNAGQTIFSEPIQPNRFQSRIIAYLGELYRPPASAYQETANWINQNLMEGDSVWVAPGYATYSLMYHAPKAIYAWQLLEKTGQFSELDAIHFYGEVLPKYIIAFGPYSAQVSEQLNLWEARGVRYEALAQLEYYWYDLIRPELFWHSFAQIEPLLENQNIRIYRQVLGK